MAQVQMMIYVHDSPTWSDNYDLILMPHRYQVMEDKHQEYDLQDDLQLEMVD